MENNISFGARFIRKIPIQKYSYEKKNYFPSSESFVELDPYELNDVKSLGDIAREFGDDSYVDNIYLDALLAYKREMRKGDPMQIFAVTRQRDRFEKLNAEDILGVAEISKLNNNEIEIDYLQVHPDLVYSYEPPYIKHVGTAIVNYLQNIYKKIILRSSPSAVPFYKKNGFQEITECSRKLSWTKHD